MARAGHERDRRLAGRGAVGERRVPCVVEWPNVVRDPRPLECRPELSRSRTGKIPASFLHRRGADFRWQSTGSEQEVQPLGVSLPLLEVAAWLRAGTWLGMHRGPLMVGAAKQTRLAGRGT